MEETCSLKRARHSSRSKRAVVTGCNRGLGQACALRLAKEGYQIAAVCRRMADAQAAVEKLPLGSVPIELDFSKGEQAIRVAAGEIASWAGSKGLSFLVNNAGNSWGYWDDEAWIDSCAVNFTGPIILTQALLPTLADSSLVTMVGSGLGDLKWISKKYQRLLTKASTISDLDKLASRKVTLLEESWVGPYGLSKALLHRGVAILADDPAWCERHIELNSVCPGWVCTDMGGPDAPISVAEGAEHILGRMLGSSPGCPGDFKCYCYKNDDEEHRKVWEHPWE